MDKILEKIGFSWQYVLLSKNYPYRYKVGISGTFDARVREIRDSVSRVVGKPVHVAPAFKVPLFFPRLNEKAIHKCLFWYKANVAPDSSGHTEWSWSLNIFTSLVLWLLLYAFDLWRWPTLLILFAPIPIDIILFTILLALVQYALAGLMIYGLWNIFF
jgi:hypothetical protein